MSPFVEAWAARLVEAFPLTMGEAESGRDFEERRAEHLPEACEFVSELVAALAGATPTQPTLPHRLVLRCAGCEGTFGIVEPGDAAYGRAPLFLCGEKCMRAYAGRAPHCSTCICGKRAPVQMDLERGKPDGTIAWSEHLVAYEGYVREFGRCQTAERLAERGGFGYGELIRFLGHEPETWRTWRAGRES